MNSSDTVIDAERTRIKRLRHNIAVKKWREANPERYTAINNKAHKKYQAKLLAAYRATTTTTTTTTTSEPIGVPSGDDDDDDDVTL
jgi:hypothetical protein